MTLPLRRAQPPGVSPSRRRMPWREHRGLALLLGLYLALGLLYSHITPLFEASDELWHYPFVKHLADGGGLPVQHPDQIGPWRQEGSQPPLYYALGALITSGIDTSNIDAIRQINPHVNMGVLTQDRNVNMVVHTPEEAFPYRGAALAAHLVRWMSVLLGGITVLCGYLLAQELFQDRPLSLSAAAFTAFNAMFLFITSSVNNDALVITLSALCLWLMVRYIAHPPTLIQWLLLGVLLGLAALTKQSALGLLFLAALTGGAVAWRKRSWKEFLIAGIVLTLSVVSIAGWWYYRNWTLYDDPLGLNAFVAIVGARNPVPSLSQLLGEWKGFVMSYWGFFGGVNVAAPEWVYLLLNVIGGLGLLAAPLYVLRLARKGQLAIERRMQLALVALWPVVVLASLIRWTLMTVASQGRLMFSALTALSLLMAMGISALWPKRRTLAPLVASGLMLVIAGLLPFATIRPAYAQPSPLSEAEAAQIPNRMEVTFGGRAQLVGYSVGEGPLAPGDMLPVTLYWRALQPMDERYSVFVHLVGEHDLIIGQRDLYPGRGNYPTTLWSPGTVFADTYMVPVAPSALTPAEVRVIVGLYQLETGARLAAADSSGAPLGDQIQLAEREMPLREEDGIPNPVYFDLGGQVALVGYSIDRTAAAPGDTVRLTLYWKAIRDLDRNYSVFAQLLGENQQKWAQKDAWPRNGEAPTASWRRGQVIEDSYELVIANDAPASVCELVVGMYDEDVQRLSLLGEGGHVQDSHIQLGKLRILSR